jgi:hypothetical protein
VSQTRKPLRPWAQPIRTDFVTVGKMSLLWALNQTHKDRFFRKDVHVHDRADNRFIIHEGQSSCEGTTQLAYCSQEIEG